ncbi:MAG: hypothetical protein HYU63_06355 [Armatimonadetes bacterium]|nr:hypothetical protein [Armatimonadota bacterium]
MLDYLSEINKCVKCGTCTTSCPIYKEEFLEQSTARGKLTLIKALNEEEGALSQ